MEEKNKNSQYFYLSFAFYGFSIFVLIFSILGAGTFLKHDTTYRLEGIVTFYVIPFQILGLIFTGIGLSKSLSFDNKQNKKLGRFGLIFGLGFLFLFLCMWFFLALMIIGD
jgi:hypothetical protein